MQVFYYLKADVVIQRSVPAAEEYVLPGLRWGRPDVLFTPAYWMTQYWMCEEGFPPLCHRLGKTLEEEVTACLLGGHGIPAEVGIAAFERLRDEGLIDQPGVNASLLADALRRPLIIRGRQTTYRFWSKKAGFLAAVLQRLRDEPAPIVAPHMLRVYLMQLPGIGPKTASWIVRNWHPSSEVAILDIHVVRAGLLMGLYSPSDRVESHYLRMERRFLDLARALAVPAANLDSLIWNRMRHSPRLVADLFSSAPINGSGLSQREHGQSMQVQLQLA